MSGLIEETINRMTSAVNQVYGPKVGIIEGCTVIVKKGSLKVADLINCAPGSMTRLSGNLDVFGGITIIPGDVHYEHVAGFISEDV